MSNLIPTPIIDKNGRATTVHKSPVISKQNDYLPIPNITTIHSSSVNAIDSAAQSLLSQNNDSLIIQNANYHWASNDKYPETLSLRDMERGSNASGNCLTVSKALISIIDELEIGDDNAEFINLSNSDENWNHTAVSVWSDDENDYIVIDFTARQFHEDLPFPYIAPQKEWKKTIQKHAEIGKLSFSEHDE